MTTQPAGAAAGADFTTQPRISVRDAEDNLVPWFTGTATVAIKPGTGRAGATLGGTLSAPISDGVASFTDLSLNLAGDGNVLVVSVPGLTSGETAPFTVAQTATKLAYTGQPGGASAGLPFTTQPVISVLDAENNVALNYDGPVTVSIKEGTGRAGAVLSGTTTLDAVAGIATFTDLSLDLAGPGYVLVADSGTLTPAESTAFTVAQTPAKLAYALQPGGASAGLPFAVQPIVLVRDAENNLVPAYDGPVTISIKDGTGREGAAPSGTTTVNAVAGIATFTDLSLDLAGAGYVLVADSGTLAAAESAPFAVAQTPTKIAFAVQPGGATAGLAFATQPVVQVRDAEDNVVAAYTGAVTLSIKAGTGTPGAVLSGPTTVNAVGGVATFAGLSIDKPSPGYVLTAGSGAFLAESAAFAVGPGAYGLDDVAKALRWAGGFSAATPLDLFTHDVETSGASNGVLDALDASRIARKVAGLEPNP